MPALQRRAPPPMPVPPAPARSPERQKLFQAQLALSGAEGLADRVEKARQAVDTKLFDTLQPAARAARERLDEAREAAPELLVDRLLGDAPTCGATVADFEAALAEAEAAVEEKPAGATRAR